MNNRKERPTRVLDVVGVVLSMALFAVIVRAELRVLIPLALAVPALLISLTALLYNRARAWPSGPEQRRSLFAAEILLRSLLLALLSVAGGVFITFFISFFLREDAFSSRQVLETTDFEGWSRQVRWWIWLYLIPCLLFFGSYVAFTQGLRIALRKRLHVTGSRSFKSLFRTMV